MPEEKTPQNENMEEKKASADEILTNSKIVKEVEFGGKKYQLHRMRIGQMLKVVRILSSESQAIAKAVTENRKGKKLSEITQAEEISIIVTTLSEEKIVELFATILDEKLEIVKNNFSLADALKLLNEASELEEIDQVFFQMCQLQTKLAGRKKQK